jgi:hypothetical protein
MNLLMIQIFDNPSIKIYGDSSDLQLQTLAFGPEDFNYNAYNRSTLATLFL